MKIYFRDQGNRFAEHLKQLKQIPVMSYEPTMLTEKTSSMVISSPKRLQELDSHFFFDYHIFPRGIMGHACEWKAERRAMRVGDTIVQQIYLPPISYLSQKVIFGVRICQITHQTDKLSFSYETLEGHVEKGISTFSLLQNGANTIEIKIHTFSKPGHPISKLLGPFFSIPYQKYCTNLALEHIRSQLEIQ